MELIILQGPPASGKSTWAREQYEKDNQRFVIVNRDSLRLPYGDTFSKDKEKLVELIEQGGIEAGLKANKSVIVDSTNLSTKRLKHLNDIAKEFNIEPKFKEFYIPFAEAVARDEKRGQEGGHSVGMKVIKRFYRDYYRERFNEETIQNIEHKRLPIDRGLPGVVICDLDGTIAWMQGRSPYDYTKVSNDAEDPRIVELLSCLLTADYRNIEVIFLSGREGTDQCCKDTYEWLKSHFDTNIATRHKLFKNIDRFQLLMRNTHDYRPDEVIKKELYELNIKGKYDVICVFEDRDKVVDMWRNEGLLCCQVNRGNF